MKATTVAKVTLMLMVGTICVSAVSDDKSHLPKRCTFLERRFQYSLGATVLQMALLSNPKLKLLSSYQKILLLQRWALKWQSNVISWSRATPRAAIVNLIKRI